MGLFRQRVVEPERREPAGFALPPVLAHAPADIVQRQARRRLSRKWRLLLGGPIVAVLAGAFGLATALVYYTLVFPNPMVLRKQERAPVIRILAADGSLLVERGQPYDYVPFDLIPPYVVSAVVATEDRRFFEHWGLDPTGLLRAAFANLRAGRYAQGGSTLTQQLAKNLFLSSERSLGRKFEELFLSLWLEVRLSKKDIFELYLNRVYFGGGAYGVEAAARRYFDKSARDLVLSEAAVIAGLLKAPSKYSPASSPTQARARARAVLAKMTAAGLLGAEAEARAALQPIRFHDPAATREITGLEYAIDHVLDRLPQISGSDQREIVVQTTIDAGLQKHAQKELTQLIAAEGEEGAASQASLVVLDTGGGIRALVGGRSYVESQFNRAVRAKRQPGSAFKPFVYLAAIESGMTPESTVYDLPFVINGWSPRNEGGSYKGAVTLRQGLAQSINTVAVRLHMDVGPKRTIAVANRLGIKSELKAGPSLALGTSEVSPLELTAAYGAFANGGYRVEPFVIRSVTTGAGHVIYRRPERALVQVAAPLAVGAMNDMLNATLVSGTGKRAALLRHPAAGKTGTSQDFRDAWFIGYTGHFIAGVWLGNDNGRAMNRIMGGTLPARLWREVMTLAHEGRPTVALPGTESRSPPKPPATRPEPRADAQSDPIAEKLVRSGRDPLRSGRDPLRPAERIDDGFVARMLGASRALARPPIQPDAPAVQLLPQPPPALHPVPQAAPGVWPGFDASRFRAALERMDRDNAGRSAGTRREPAPGGMMSLGGERGN